MRIGIDARLFAYQPAGIGYYTKRLVAALADLPDPLQLTVFESRRQVGPLLSHGRVRRRRLWTPPHHRWEQIGLALELFREPIDVLHSPDFIPPFYRRCRSVITIHDLAFVRYPNLLTPESLRYYRQVDRAIESADAIIAVSQCTKADLVELYGAPREKVVVIPEAADPFFRPRQEGEAVDVGVLPTRAPFILFVGTLEPRKNLPTLLRAFQRLQRCGRPEHLVLVGQQGWLVDDLTDLIQSLGVADVVHRVGPLSMADLRATYWQASVLAMPSIYEGFGLPIVEAMACGTPVVASRAGALPEIVGDAGLLVDPMDDAALADALARLLEDDRLRADLRARGFQRVTGFRWERTARETYALYQKVAAA